MRIIFLIDFNDQKPPYSTLTSKKG